MLREIPDSNFTLEAVTRQENRAVREPNNGRTRCVRCVLSDVYPSITFDSSGQCNFCAKWDKNWGNTPQEGASAALLRQFAKARAPRAQYDCLVGLSGGKDSSYAALLCAQHDLRQLAVTYDNGFLSDEARQNIETVVKQLSIPHLTYGPGWKML